MADSRMFRMFPGFHDGFFKVGCAYTVTYNISISDRDLTPIDLPPGTHVMLLVGYSCTRLTFIYATGDSSYGKIELSMGDLLNYEHDIDIQPMYCKR